MSMDLDLPLRKIRLHRITELSAHPAVTIAMDLTRIIVSRYRYEQTICATVRPHYSMNTLMRDLIAVKAKIGVIILYLRRSERGHHYEMKLQGYTFVYELNKAKSEPCFSLKLNVGLYFAAKS